MIRSEVYWQFGGLDEDLFAHMEEIDLCWKINRSGQKIYYCGKSAVYHLGAGTLAYENATKIYLNFRNGLVLIFKHFDTAELVYKLPFRLALDWLAALMFALKGKGKNSISVFRAHFHFFRSFEIYRQKRTTIQQKYPSYSRANIHPGLIIFDYYLRGRKRLKSIVPDGAPLS
jgi:GT2 family glycosyltransferase